MDPLHYLGSGNILTVADDLLKNDGRKFLEMMEQLAERRMQREEEAAAEVGMDSQDEEDDEDGDEDDDDEEEEEEDDDDEEEVVFILLNSLLFLCLTHFSLPDYDRGAKDGRRPTNVFYFRRPHV